MEHEGFIVPPPGLIPEHVEATRDPAPTVRPASFPVFSTASAPTPPPAPVIPAAEAPPHGAWRLELADGQRLVVERSLVLGRDPASVPARPHAMPVAIVDPAKSVSKTHAIIDLEGAELSITDLHSTNGVLVVDPQGGELDLAPGARAVLQPGSRVELGSFVVRVQRA